MHVHRVAITQGVKERLENGQRSNSQPSTFLKA